MSETQVTEGTEPDVDVEESATFKELRSQVRALQKELKSKDESLAQFETERQSARESAAKSIVDDLGLPGMKEDVLNGIEGEINAASVEAYLAEKLPAEVLEALKSSDSEPAVEKTLDQAPDKPASEIAQRVADAAAGGAVKDLTTQIGETTSRDELNALMRERGLAKDHIQY